jgi:hypothetical protein
MDEVLQCAKEKARTLVPDRMTPPILDQWREPLPQPIDRLSYRQTELVEHKPDLPPFIDFKVGRRAQERIGTRLQARRL